LARIINYAGLALIKEAEGYRDHAYQDTGGVWTIGYGHTRGVKMGDSISHERAEMLLEADLMDG
jgi:lysozyme